MGLFDVAVENVESKDVIKITLGSGTENFTTSKSLVCRKKELLSV